jgi:CheY-like chemotaxis protein
LDRRTPTILLIDDDDADRMTLGRMLEEAGYRVMAVSRGADALHTFVIHHLHIALVLSRPRLSDVSVTELCDALFRIDRHVPVVMADRHVYHGANGLDEESRREGFAETIADVRRRLPGTIPDASYFRSSADSSMRSDWPVGSEDVDTTERVGDDAQFRLPRDLRGRRNRSDRGARRDVLEPARRPKVLTITSPDPRKYLARVNRARRSRLRRLGRMGIMAAAICIVLVTALLGLRTKPARAIEQEAMVIAPLSSAAISERVGIVRLVPAARVQSSNLADDVTPRLRQASRRPRR